MPTPHSAAAAATFTSLPRQGRAAARSGPAFVEEVRGYLPPAGTLAVWYMGQESVIWKSGASTVWIDPYLSPNAARRYAPFCAPADVLEAADVVLITHEHSDHLDPQSCAGIAAASPGACFIAPALCGPMLRDAGIAPGRILTPTTGEPAAVGDWRFTALPCAHEEIDFTPARGHRWTGYVAEIGGRAYYHAGDTVACDELLAALLPWVDRLDLAMLPINGRDYFRRAGNILGNFTFREAAEVALRLGAGLTVPMHYDLFHQMNDERPAHFVDYIYDKAPYLPIAIMAPGQRLLVAPAAGGRPPDKAAQQR